MMFYSRIFFCGNLLLIEIVGVQSQPPQNMSQPPQNMPSWHIDYFELKTTEEQQMHEGHADLTFSS